MSIYDLAEMKKVSLRQMMDFTSDVNPLGPSSKARHAARKAIKTLGLFPDEKIRYLRRYISRQEGINEAMVIFGHGSTHLFDVLLGTLRPTVVGISSPFQERYGDLFAKHAISIRPYPLSAANGYALDVTKFLKDTEGVDMLSVSNPHDISGNVLSADNLARLVAEAENRDMSLVINESYSGFVDVSSPVANVVASRNSIILRTFSLFHGLAGLRLGYGIASNALLERMSAAMGRCPINEVAPHAAIASLRDKGHMKRTRRFVAEEKAYFLERLKGIEGLECIDTACNFLLLKLGKEHDGLAGMLLKKNMVINEYQDGDGNLLIKLPVKTRRMNARFLRTFQAFLRG